MNDFVISSITLIIVFIVGYIVLDKLIPKNKKAYIISIATLVTSGGFVFILFHNVLIMKAVSWGLIWLGVIAINKLKKLPHAQ